MSDQLDSGLPSIPSQPQEERLREIEQRYSDGRYDWVAPNGWEHDGDADVRYLLDSLSAVTKDRDELKAQMCDHEKCIAEETANFNESLDQALDRAEAAETALSTLQAGLRALIAQWQGRTGILDMPWRCADEAEKLLEGSCPPPGDGEQG